MGKVKGDHKTADLFDVAERFPVHAPRDLPRALDLKTQIALDMGAAIRESGKSSPAIAALMTELLGDDEVTSAQLYAYTAESRTTHNISLYRFVAFVRATGALWLWDKLLAPEGLTVLQGPEALHAQASLAEAEGRRLLDQAKQLRAQAPVKVRVRRGARA